MAMTKGQTNSGSFKRGRVPHNRKHASRHAAYLFHKHKTIERNWVRQIGELGCTPEIYRELAEKQSYLCAICRRPNGSKRLAVDHDHLTGKIRGLLCNRCNTALGSFDDRIELLNRAMEYLNASESSIF